MSPTRRRAQKPRRDGTGRQTTQRFFELTLPKQRISGGQQQPQSEEDAPALRAFVASPAPPLAATATEAEVLAQGERLLNEPGLNLTEQEKEAVRMAMAIIRRE